MCKLYWTYLWERVNNPVMAHVQNLSKHSQKIVVVGAGIGGLAAALRLSTLGHKVRVIEAAPTPGGKIRTLSGANNPIDLGPTVLTLLPVFERLFSDVGENLHDHISVTQQHILARHGGGTELAWIWMQISKHHTITSEMHLEKNPLLSSCHTILTLQYCLTVLTNPSCKMPIPIYLQ